MNEFKPRPLVSIIVPFYNIKECVSYCLKSLLNQTYTNYEIVCVDDGSTDDTGRILDLYSQNPQVIVLHKENGGLSDARNYGIRYASGQYITFVDGDDVVSPYYLEALTAALREHPNGMSIGQFQYLEESETTIDAPTWKRPKTINQLSKREIISAYMYETVLPGAVSRLAPKQIYVNRPFPRGMLYEEIATAAGYVADVESVSIIEEPIYGYVMRSGSIVHRKHASYAQIEDYFRAIDQFVGLTENQFKSETPESIHFHALHYSRIYRMLEDAEGISNEQANLLRRELVNNIQITYHTLITDKRISKGNKLRFTVLCKWPNGYCKCFNTYERLFKRRG